MKTPSFPEALLHYIWKFRLFEHQDLQTTEGEYLQIEQPGLHNRQDAGPDFSQARIRIGNTLWAGQVEIHKLSSDWERHHHQQDIAYDNVILHVVYEYDRPVRRKDGSEIPCLELKNRIDEGLLLRSEELLQSPEQVPCSAHLTDIPELAMRMWLERLVVERLEAKTEAVFRELEHTKNHWESAFYVFLARNFGTPVNAEPFEQLARSLPLSVLAKQKDKLLQIEALLFGQAGFLEGITAEETEEYPRLLRREYDFLRNKYNLQPIAAAAWKFGRMRPAAFPTVRLALFAQLVYQSTHLFSKFLETESLSGLRQFFELKVSNYWLEHYRFGEKSEKRGQKSLGKNSFENIVINTLVPFLFVYGKAQGDENYCERALLWLEQLAAEENIIIKMWREIGVKAENALHSQALLHLKKQYCDQKHCLDCAIGNKILRG